jgi:hypothetical protein
MNDKAPTFTPVRTDRELFRLDSFPVWVNHAARDFRRATQMYPPSRGSSPPALAAGGFLCDIGAHFMAARDAGRFPVRVLLLAGG